MKSLAVVILNYNGIKLIKKFLPSVIKFTPIRYNIYIIDNGSSDGSVKFIRSNFKRIKIVQLNKNYGFAKYAGLWYETFNMITDELGSWDTRKNYKNWKLTEV